MMKYFSIIVFSLCVFMGRTQNNTLSVQVSHVQIHTDSSTNAVKKLCYFKLTAQPPSNLKTVTIKAYDNNNNIVSNWGTYTLFQHANGFYYIDSQQFGKITIMGNEIYFVKHEPLGTFSNIKVVKLACTSQANVTQHLSFNMPSN